MKEIIEDRLANIEACMIAYALSEDTKYTALADQHIKTILDKVAEMQSEIDDLRQWKNERLL